MALRRSTTRGSNQTYRSPRVLVLFSKLTLPSGSVLAIAANASALIAIRIMSGRRRNPDVDDAARRPLAASRCRHVAFIQGLGLRLGRNNAFGLQLGEQGLPVPGPRRGLGLHRRHAGRMTELELGRVALQRSEQAGAETGGGLTGAEAAGLAVAIDAVRVGAPSRGGSGSGVMGGGVQSGGGLAGTGAAGLAVAIDPVRVGAASWSNDLVPRRS